MNTRNGAVELAYRESGTGPALVILHGLFGSAANFGGLAKHLSERYRVIRVDLRNHGSSPHAADMSYTAMAADVILLLQRLALDQAILLGHSMGGKVAMRLALQYPEQVKALAVADIAPTEYRFRHSAMLAAMQALPMHSIGSRQDADRWLSDDIPDRRVRQFILQNLVQKNGGYGWRLNLTALVANDSTIAGFPMDLCPFQGTAPVQFIAGEHSDYLSPDLHDAVYTCFPAANIITLSDTGHWLHAEKPELFLNTLRSFLQQAV